MSFVPLGISQGFFSRLLLPHGTLGVVRIHEPLRHSHVSVVIALASQVQLFRTRNES